MIEVRVLGDGEAHALDRVAPDVFDQPIRPELAAEFLSDSRHHIAVAIEDDVVVGFASGVHYLHPDKPPELWINEIGVAPTHQRQGIATRVLEALLARGRELGCREAWVLTERDNEAAVALYASAGGLEWGDDTRGFSFRIAEGDASDAG